MKGEERIAEELKDQTAGILGEEKLQEIKQKDQKLQSTDEEINTLKNKMKDYGYKFKDLEEIKEKTAREMRSKEVKEMVKLKEKGQEDPFWRP